MKHRLFLVGMAIIFGFVGVGVLLVVVGSQAQAAAPTPSWLQVGGNGLGDPENKQIATLAVFGDYLYAGAWHYDGISKTAQIYRTNTGLDWIKVDDRPVDGPADMIAFGGKLYAGSWDGYVWSSQNGLAWTEVITDGFDGSGQGIARFVVYKDELYASTWGKSGTEVWRTSDGVHWDIFIDNGLNDAKNSAAIASEVFNGYLYLGVVNDGITGGQVWRTNGITTTAIITNGFGITENQAISSLAMFQHMLYAGTYNLNGVQVWQSSNGITWQKINSSFNNPNTAGVNGLEVYRDRLYLTVENDSNGFEVWRTSNGSNWGVVGSYGLGYTSNHSSYWDNSTVVFKDKLYIGTINWPLGGQVWQMTGEPYQRYLACTLKGFTACPVYTDDFSDPATGWPQGDDDYATVRYLNGEYQIIVKYDGDLVFAYGDFGSSNFRLEVDVRRAFNQAGAQGLVFNYDDDGFYLFEIDSSQGVYTLWRYDTYGSGWTMLIDWTSSSAILRNQSTNHLKIVRQGTNIFMYANGKLLTTKVDGTHMGTSLGMEAEAFSTNYDVRFDNLTVQTQCLNSAAISRPFSNASSFGIIKMEPRTGINMP